MWGDGQKGNINFRTNSVPYLDVPAYKTKTTKIREKLKPGDRHT